MSAIAWSALTRGCLQAAVKKEKGKATKEKATAKDKGSAKAAPAKAPSAKKAKKSPATKPTQAEETTAAPVSGKKRKAPASEEKPAKVGRHSQPASPACYVIVIAQAFIHKLPPC